MRTSGTGLVIGQSYVGKARFWIKSRRTADVVVRLGLSSRPEEFHPRALPEPCMNLSIHTAPDVRPLP
jgi:hypothetical protein